MNKQIVIFIGGLTNGKIVYDYLKKNKFVDLKLVITYPNNLSKPRFTEFPNEKGIIKTDNANKYIKIIKDINPDFIFVAGWSELLTNELINIPKRGTIGFHPAKLPNDRGRSVLAWQIEEGYSETALTMFYYNNLPDGGDIIASEKIKIEYNDYISDILNKVDKATYNLMYAYFPLLRSNIAPRSEQKQNEGNFRRLRKEKDTWIDWNQNSENIYNKIRAISKPYPGAIAFINKEKYRVWKSFIIKEFPFGHNIEPGKIVAKLFDDSMIIKTKNSFIRILEWDIIK